MAEPTRPDWDPRDPSVLRDQRQADDEMRDRCPVAHSDFLGWSLFAHRDVVEAVSEQRPAQPVDHAHDTS